MLFLLPLVLVLLLILYYPREGFKNYSQIERSSKWDYFNLFFPRYEWRHGGKQIIATPHVVEGPGVNYRRLDSVAPERIQGNSTIMPVKEIIDECQNDNLNCHNIVHDKRTGQNYVNAFSTTDKLVYAPGYVTYVRTH
jgi:hypothetical protein